MSNSCSKSKLSAEDGILLVDKPAAWTSHDVVKFVRGFGLKKVGHCGTLDPDATGLLVLVVNFATKYASQFTNQDKNYQGGMCIGVTTDTQDSSGQVQENKDWSYVTEDLIEEGFSRFSGEQLQVPPMVSAKKIGGQPLYKLARKGIIVDREPVPITIHKLTIDKIQLPIIDFTVTCSKGTYIRTLCYDIGKVLGCGAHLKSLRRLVSGCFNLEDAFPVSEIKTWNKESLMEHIIPLDLILPQR